VRAPTGSFGACGTHNDDYLLLPVATSIGKDKLRQESYREIVLAPNTHEKYHDS
jgi:hypothetical protein